jgi:hypothetical protein
MSSCMTVSRISPSLLATIALVLAATATACSAESGSHPGLLGLVPDTQIDTDGGTTTNPKPDAAANTPDAGTDSAATVDAAPVLPTSAPKPVCDPTRTFANPSKLSVSSNAIEAMPTIANDGLTVAWITPNDGVVHYADRADLQSAFSASKTIADAGLATGERVALSRDGHMLYGVRADRHAIVSFTRSSDGDDFVSSGTATLDNVDGEIVNGESVSDVVVSATGLALVYRRVGGSSPGIRLATRVMPTDTWSTTVAFAAQTELTPIGQKARRPTGLSADKRALFFFDEVTEKQMVGFFDWDATTATTFADLGARTGTSPNADCTTLYYESSSDLWSTSSP